MGEPQEGRNGWISPEQHRTARAMAGYGAPRSSIAAYLRMDVRRMNELLGAELEQAEAEANTKVAQALFLMATKQNNVAAAIFWMKARAGWRDKIEIRPVIETDVSQMSDAELDAEIARLQREVQRSGAVLEGTVQDLGDGQVAPRSTRAG